MHPYMHEQMMKARQAELCRQAAHARGALRPARPRLRQDVGWLLVHLGLRLAVGSAQRSRTAPTT
jgi:hypothetical protein